MIRSLRDAADGRWDVGVVLSTNFTRPRHPYLDRLRDGSSRTPEPRQDRGAIRALPIWPPPPLNATGDGSGELLTARLRLRLPAAGDAPVIQRIHEDSAAVAHNPSDALAGRDAAEGLLRRWVDRWRRDGVGYWSVTGRSGPAVLGFCGVKPMRLAGAPVLNLFYRFDPAGWGRGLATEAVVAVIGWAAHVRPDQTLIARMRPNNPASARVAAKAGPVRALGLDTVGEDGLDHIWV